MARSSKGSAYFCERGFLVPMIWERIFARASVLPFLLFAALVIFAAFVSEGFPGTTSTWPTVGGDSGRTIVVTTRADAGPGSLREALRSSGRRKIVFKVAGEIWLKEMLRINQPFVTVAGETAPSPGITLMGDTVKIHTHDVIFRHIRIHVGARADGTRPKERDGIQIIGASTDPSYNILIENCSVFWSIDELVSTYGSANQNISIRRSILAEALNNSIHPEGAHSAGPRIGPATKNMLLQQNLMAHNGFRNPLIGSGSAAVIVNNLIYDPGEHGVHFSGSESSDAATRASVVSNVVIRGPSTSQKPRLRAFEDGLPAGSKIYYKDNVSIGVKAFDKTETLDSTDRPIPFVLSPPIWLPGIAVLPSEDVQARVLAQAGARPWDRDKVDARIIAEVRSRGGRIRDVPTDPRLAPN